MALDSTTPLQAIKTLLESVTGIQSVTIGAPESFPARVSAYVTVGGQRISDRLAGGLIERELDYFCAFGYRVKGAEATAETTIAAAIDDLITKVYAARKADSGLFSGGTQTNTDRPPLDLSLASVPDYQTVAGQENRVWPFMVTVTQRANT